MAASSPARTATAVLPAASIDPLRAFGLVPTGAAASTTWLILVTPSPVNSPMDLSAAVACAAEPSEYVSAGPMSRSDHNI